MHSMASWRVVALTLAFAGPAAGLAAAQTGTVGGRVTDQTGGALPGVSVNLRAGSAALETTTDGEGRYRLEGLPAGPAEITFKLINFSVLRRNVLLGRAPIEADAALQL